MLENMLQTVARITRVVSTRHLFIFLVSLSLLLACGQNGSSSTGTNTPATPTPALDVYGTPIVFPKTAPQRIVSLIPSISEILGALPLQSRIVGVDYDTNYPVALSSLPKVSDANGVYNVERIVALKPDLVLSYGADTKQYDTQLKQLGLHVVDLAALDVSQTIQEIRLVGRLTFTQTAADALAQDMQRQIDDIRATVAGTTAPSVLLEVDDSSPGKPYVFGGTSFGDELALDANAHNIFHDNTSNGGFPQVSDEAVIKANPQYIILTENLAYGGNVNLVYKRANWGNIDAVKAHRVYHINSDIMQRPGPRLVQGLQCLAQILHPDKFPGALPAYCSASV
ncbi:MAG: ABC transporter substrate-binding protein, partial [Ktedonobacteraceae bacterium]|nr:ABC transporter substrate-binding protein [Ktedonobacteraceae bacterium]